jgi:hypothetical protein
MTYGEVSARVADVASALAALGVPPQGRVGIYSANCVEWMIAMQARLAGAFDRLPPTPAAATGRARAAGARHRLERACSTPSRLGSDRRERAAGPSWQPDPSARMPRPPPPQACNRMSYECVPLYDSLGDHAVEFVLRHSQVDGLAGCLVAWLLGWWVGFGGLVDRWVVWLVGRSLIAVLGWVGCELHACARLHRRSRWCCGIGSNTGPGLLPPTTPSYNPPPTKRWRLCLWTPASWPSWGHPWRPSRCGQPPATRPSLATSTRRIPFWRRHSSMLSLAAPGWGGLVAGALLRTGCRNGPKQVQWEWEC